MIEIDVHDLTQDRKGTLVFLSDAEWEEWKKTIVPGAIKILKVRKDETKRTV